MRAKFFATLVLVGGIALVLGVNQGHTQPGRGGPSGGKGSYDPMARFEQYAKGRGFFFIDEVTDDPSRKARLATYAQQKGITDGKITTEAYQGYVQQFTSGGFRGPTGGGAPPGGGYGGAPPGGGYGGGAPPGGGYGGGTPGGGTSGRGPSGGSQSGGVMGMMGDPSQMFDRFAAGKDVLRRSDLQDPMMQMMFDRMADRMGITDGQITRQQFNGMTQQFMAMRSGGGGSSGSSGGGNNDGNADSEFRRRDRNGDGLLNYDEMSDTLRSEREKWDANGDGFVDLNEYKAYMEARTQQRAAERAARDGDSRGGNPDFPLPELPDESDKKPTVFRAGNLPRELPAWFKELDADTDAQIGLYEWKSSKRSFDEFNKIDRNGDGFVTIDETLRYVAQAKASGSPGEMMAIRGPGGSNGNSGPPRGPGGNNSPGGNGPPSGPGGYFRGPGGPPSGPPQGGPPSNGNNSNGSSDRRGPPTRPGGR